MITAEQAASILQVDRSLVVRWCRENRFSSAQKFGNAWALDRQEVEQFASKERKVGRPAKEKNYGKINKRTDERNEFETEQSSPLSR